MISFREYVAETTSDVTHIIHHSIKHSGFSPDALCSGGRCYEFAHKLKRKLKLLGHDAHVMDSTEWIRNHNRYGGELGWAEESNLLDNNHAWVYHNGKHYDALNPEGVDRPRDMKFFKSTATDWHEPDRDEKQYQMKTTGKKYSREQDKFV